VTPRWKIRREWHTRWGEFAWMVYRPDRDQPEAAFHKQENAFTYVEIHAA
jgi:hypothetical protein